MQVGFMTIDALAQREGVRAEKVQLKSAVARCSVAGQRVLLAKPLTYMNLCGESIGKLAKFYKVWRLLAIVGPDFTCSEFRNVMVF